MERLASFLRVSLGAVLFLSAGSFCVLYAGMAFNRTDLGAAAGLRLECMAAALLFSAAAFLVWRSLLSRRSAFAPTRGGSGGGQAAPPSGSSAPRPPDAGKPVPLKPSPTHHLVAAKDLPPSDITHSLPKD